MLTHLGNWVRRWSSEIDPWTNVYGLARTMLALATAGTLAFNPTSFLFRPAGGVPTFPVCTGIRHASAFCLVPSTCLEVVRWLAVAVLLVVASGWRPRVTGVLHWWIAFSLQAAAVVVDGGDQLTAVLTLLLVPVTLTDARESHWEPAREAGATGAEEVKRIIAHMALALVRLQVAGVYFHAALGKAVAQEWADGTATYYWLTNHDFGAPGWLAPLLRPIVTSSLGAPLLTWGVVVLEFLLCAALVMDKKRRGPLLVAGFALHGGIMVVHGLVSFSTVMMAALILFLRPSERSFTLPSLHSLARRLVRSGDSFIQARARAW
jgi:antimicrobial peptide system SdpB family protein